MNSNGKIQKEYLDYSDKTKVRITIEMEFKNEDFLGLDNRLVWAYRKFSEMTQGNIVSGKVEEI